MSESLFSMLDDLSFHDAPETRDECLRAPFPYPGSKARSIEKILPLLPYREAYIEPFGGSGAVLLARRPSKLEVFNDRYAGVVAFYRCIRDSGLMHQLCERLELTVHSREEFVWSKESWENHDDLVERAARWYYMLKYSFGSLGRNFGRSTSSKASLSTIHSKLELFPKIHERFKCVQVENQDWLQCIKDYDNPNAVFYIDPPYIDTDSGVYKHKMDQNDHRRLLEFLFTLKGFVAVSGYANALYDSQSWDDKHSWEAFVSIKSVAYTESNNKKQLEGIEDRGMATECVWIKEAR